MTACRRSRARSRIWAAAITSALTTLRRHCSTGWWSEPGGSDLVPRCSSCPLCPSWRSFLEARSPKAFAISAIPPGVGEDRGGGGANDESPSEQSPGANGLASDCPRPHRVQDRFEQQEQRGLERGQGSNRAAQTDVR